MNSVNLIGRIVRDLELRTSSGGKSYVFFTIAVNSFNGSNELTDFIPCTAWEKQAENMVKFLKKGSQVGVTGSLNVRSIRKENGEFETRTSVSASRIEFLGARSNSNLNDDPNLVMPDSNYDFDQISSFSTPSQKNNTNDKKEETKKDSYEDPESILWE